MSKLALALAMLAASGSGATAACHHYSRWYYSKPQTCGASVMRARAATAHDWYVEITKLPPLPDLSKDTVDAPALDEERKAAIAELKARMK